MFKTSLVSKNDIGDLMKTYAEEEGIMSQPRKTSALDARRQGDENLNTSVVAETMKLLANSSYGYQIMDRSRHTVTKYLTDEKTHAAINSKLFKKLGHVNV